MLRRSGVKYILGAAFLAAVYLASLAPWTGPWGASAYFLGGYWAPSLINVLFSVGFAKLLVKRSVTKKIFVGLLISFVLGSNSRLLTIPVLLEAKTNIEVVSHIDQPVDLSTYGDNLSEVVHYGAVGTGQVVGGPYLLADFISSRFGAVVLGGPMEWQETAPTFAEMARSVLIAKIHSKEGNTYNIDAGAIQIPPPYFEIGFAGDGPYTMSFNLYGNNGLPASEFHVLNIPPWTLEPNAELSAQSLTNHFWSRAISKLLHDNFWSLILNSELNLFPKSRFREFLDQSIKT